MEHSTTGNRHELLKISGSPRSAQFDGPGIKFASGRDNAKRLRVAVTPKEPAVPVDADRVTPVTPRMNLPEAAAGTRLFNGSMKLARRVAASETPVRFPVVPSL